MMFFSLNKDRPSGPNEFSGEVFQNCWNIIEKDMVRVVMIFLCGMKLPKYTTHTNLILIPKKESIKRMADLRLINLSTYINKVISKIIHERIMVYLPSIISENQSGFMKGRSITENVLLA